jgi:zinc D-Ala-D-Ala carboxypeptidase
MQLSEHLSLTEAIKSATGKRLGISNIPPASIIETLKLTAEKVFEPIRKHFGVPIYVVSGYRCKALNDAIGGSKTSQHMQGEAFDIDMDGTSSGITNRDIFMYIKDNLVFDQLIWEFGNDQNPSWVHVSYESKGLQRKQVLRAVKRNGRTAYIAYR